MGKRMKLALSVLTVALFLSVASNAMAISLNYASLTGSTVTFTGTGDTFVFNPESGGFDFAIGSVSDGTGSAVGFNGRIEGTFTIGSITTLAPGYQTASVTGPGTLSIFDGTTSLTASLDWVSIYTLNTTGGINAGGDVNLTSISYSGTDADLLALATLGAGSGVANATFNFVPALSLTQLT
ncbi:MAG: hypothetical protein ABIO65_13165, partial [Nitrospiria bacterium]